MMSNNSFKPIALYARRLNSGVRCTKHNCSQQTIGSSLLLLFLSVHNKPYTNWEIYRLKAGFFFIAIVGEVIATSALKSSEGFTKLAPSAVVIIGYGIAFYFLSLVLKSIPVGVAYAVWSGLGVVIITAIAWLLHGQKLDAWGFVGMGLIIAAFLLARSPSWKSLRRPTPW